MGYGASTKGNVLLQFCGFNSDDIEAIAEVNPDKFGHVTPGSGIPIVPEEEMRERQPDYVIVFPWHFRDNILERERQFLENGGRMIFPLPGSRSSDSRLRARELEIVVVLGVRVLVPCVSRS